MGVKKTKGFSILEGVAVLAALAALVGAVAGVIHLVNSHDEEIRKSADKGGYDRAMKEVEARDNTELTRSRQEVIDLTKKVRGLEQALADRSAKISALLEEQRKRSQADEDATLHSLDDVGHVLRDGIVEVTRCPEQVRADRATAGPGSPGQPPAKTCYRFSAASEKFLLDLARESRDNAEQAIAVGDAYDAAKTTVNSWRP